MDYGTYLKGLLERKNVNLTHLAEEIGIKSKNEFYRAFKNKYSYNKTCELSERIFSAVECTDEEREYASKLIEHLKTKDSTRRAFDILADVYSVNAETALSAKARKLERMLEKYKNAEIKVFIGVNTDKSITMVLDKLLRENSNAKLIHRLDFNRPDDILAEEMFAVLKLITHDNYNGYECPRMTYSGVAMLICHKNRYFTIIEEGDGYVESFVSKELYNYMIKKITPPEKNAIKSYTSSMFGYGEMIKRFSVVDKNPSFFFGGMFCFMEIPFDILLKLLEDSNYFGMSKECDYITSLIAAADERCRARDTTRMGKTFVISEKPVRRFLRTGMTVDHFYYFRALRRTEMRAMIENIGTRRQNYKYRFLKDGYEVRENPYCMLVKNYGIVMFNADVGYGDKHFYTVIKSQRVVKLFEEFSSFVWENYTVSDKESEERMLKIVGEYFS